MKNILAGKTFLRKPWKCGLSFRQKISIFDRSNLERNKQVLGDAKQKSK